MPDAPRILVIRRKAIGDIVVSLAVPRALRQRWPDAQIDLVVDRFAVDVVGDVKELDDVLVYDPQWSRQKSPWGRSRAMLQWMSRLRRGKYDLVIDLMGTPQTASWTRWTGAPIRVGRRRRWRTWAYNRVLPPDTGPTRFAGEVFLDFVRALDIQPKPWAPVRLVAASSHRHGGERRRVLLNPSASWSAKAWPLEHFAKLARLLAQDDIEVAVAWGPGEEGARDRILELAGGVAQALPRTTLRELARTLSEFDLLITTDSGPKHIAVAQGTPTLTLFGSTAPAGWQPPGRLHAGLVNEVDCHPCDLTECPVPGHPCLDELLPERVHACALELLNRGREGAAA